MLLLGRVEILPNYRQIGCCHKPWPGWKCKKAPVIHDILAHHFILLQVFSVHSPGQETFYTRHLCWKDYSLGLDFLIYTSSTWFKVILSLPAIFQSYLLRVIEFLFLFSMYSSNASEWNGGEMQRMHFCCVSKHISLILGLSAHLSWNTKILYMVLMPKTWSLCTDLNLGDRVLGEVGDDSCNAFQSKGRTQWAHAPQNCVSQPGKIWWGVFWQWFKGRGVDKSRMCAGPSLL